MSDLLVNLRGAASHGSVSAVVTSACFALHLNGGLLFHATGQRAACMFSEIQPEIGGAGPTGLLTTEVAICMETLSFMTQNCFQELEEPSGLADFPTQGHVGLVRVWCHYLSLKFPL